MAIIRSIAVGKARKSAGNVTFRTVRGRTIMSEKVAERPVTKGEGYAMSPVQFTFACLSRFAAAHASDINVSFDATRYGSQRNYFAKLNYYAFSQALSTLYASKPDAGQVTDTEIEQAIADYAEGNPSAIYRVRRSGYTTVYLNGAWVSSDNPAPAEDAATVTAFTVDSINVPETDADNYATGNPVVITGTNLNMPSIRLQICGSSPQAIDSVLSSAQVTATSITGNLIDDNTDTVGEVTIAVYQGSNALYSETLQFEDQQLG